MDGNQMRQWHRSTRCGSEATCIEVAYIGDEVLIRGSRRPDGPVLSFTREEWAAFVAGIKRGDFSD